MTKTITEEVTVKKAGTPYVDITVYMFDDPVIGTFGSKPISTSDN